MKQKIADLIDLKTIVTLVLIGGLTTGFFLNKIDGKDFFTIVTMVVTYYFSRKE